jgi:hypothetical protein
MFDFIVSQLSPPVNFWFIISGARHLHSSFFTRNRVTNDLSIREQRRSKVPGT